MGNKLISEGDKIDFSEVLSATQKNDGMKANVYASQIFECHDDRHIRVAMPIQQGRIVPLSKGKEYDAFFYTSKGMYRCTAVILDRFKNGNIYSMEVEFTSELKKYQRRQYYRLEKNFPIYYAGISEEEYQYIATERKFPERLLDAGVFSAGNTLDISGGGLRFVGTGRIRKGQHAMILFEITVDDKTLKYRLPSTVIASEEQMYNHGKFEHRVEFENISEQYRDMLIKYIFEEERRIRKRTN
ncbi:MAG: flagellar brake protein [Butyrivibrio sp.]